MSCVTYHTYEIDGCVITFTNRGGTDYAVNLFGARAYEAGGVLRLDGILSGVSVNMTDPPTAVGSGTELTLEIVLNAINACAGASGGSSGGAVTQITKDKICFEVAGVPYEGWEIQIFAGTESVERYAVARNAPDTEYTTYNVIDCFADTDTYVVPLAVDFLQELVSGEATNVNAAFHSNPCPTGQATTWVASSPSNCSITTSTVSDGIFEVTATAAGAYSFTVTINCDGVSSGQSFTVQGTAT